MKSRNMRKILTFLLVLTLMMVGISGCKSKTKDEGGNGNTASDGTDGSADNSNTAEDLPGTDTSDATGEGSDIEGDDVETTEVEVTVITENEIRDLVEKALGREFSTIYDMDYQDEVEHQLELLQVKDTYSLEKPLFVLNPYGTNRLGMYVYFNTDKDAFLEYTISVNDQSIYDFTRHLYSNEDTEAEKEHEGYVIGLVPGVENTVTFRSYDKKNKITDKYVYKIAMPESTTINQTVLDVTQEKSLEELSDGLFTIFEISNRARNKEGHILFYDNTGVVRCEIPLDGNSANSRIEFVDQNMIYACSDNQFALVDEDGKVEYIYTLNGFTLHHDFDYDKDEDCLITLASNNSSKTKEDSVVLLNLENGEYEELFSFTELLPVMKKSAVNSATDPQNDGEGWLQLNSIQIVDTNNILVGSRELNSIIKVDYVRESPRVAYIISDPIFWKDTEYTDLLLKPDGNFTPQVGQYNITYSTDNDLKDHQYYIHMYNNNYGDTTQYQHFNFDELKNIGTKEKDATSSFYYRYLVDEDAGTYKLEESIDVPYSSYLGSTQEVDGNRVICSGEANVFGEYDASGNLIAQYKVEVPKEDKLYRVYKYKMDGYWFN